MVNRTYNCTYLRHLRHQLGGCEFGCVGGVGNSSIANPIANYTSIANAMAICVAGRLLHRRQCFSAVLKGGCGCGFHHHQPDGWGRRGCGWRGGDARSRGDVVVVIPRNNDLAVGGIVANVGLV